MFKKHFTVSTFMDEDLKFSVFDVDDDQVLEHNRMGDVVVNVARLLEEDTISLPLAHNTLSERNKELQEKDSCINLTTTKLKGVTLGKPKKGKFLVGCRFVDIFKLKKMY